VARTPVPGNRKEIELSPTADGELVVDAHRQLHEEMADGLHDFLLRYSGAELQVLAKVLRDLQAARKVGVRLVVGNRAASEAVVPVMANQSRAVQFDQYGGIDVLEVRTYASAGGTG